MESSFAIIAEPNRRAILSLLVSSEQSVGEIERQLRMPQTVGVQAPARAARGRLRGVARGRTAARLPAQARAAQEVDAWLAPFRRFWSAHVDALERHLDRMEQAHQRKGRQEDDERSRDSTRRVPPAGRRYEKDGEKWTLILVRELRHPPAKVWQALTDPAQLSEWAPFDADRNLAAVGPVKLSTVGTPTPQVSETTVKRAEAPRLLEYSWGGSDLRWELEPLGSGTRLTLWHNIDRRFISWGAAGWHICFDVLERLLAGEPDWTHRRRRGHEVRRLAAIDRRVRKAVRR